MVVSLVERCGDRMYCTVLFCTSVRMSASCGSFNQRGPVDDETYDGSVSSTLTADSAVGSLREDTDGRAGRCRDLVSKPNYPLVKS